MEIVHRMRFGRQLRHEFVHRVWTIDRQQSKKPRQLSIQIRLTKRKRVS
jgi:hypothetical protein